MDRRKLRILLRHRAAMAGLGLLILFALLAVFIGLLSPHDPHALMDEDKNQAPSWSHLLGSDHWGRDIFTRLFYAGRLSLLIGLACVAFSAAIGVPMGAAAGYFGGWIDMVVSRIVDVMLSFPSILLAICIAAPMGASLKTVIIAVGVIGVPRFARQIRASVLAIREYDFVQACRALGAGHARILFIQILPNALGPIIVLATLGMATSILSAAGLSFLGLGVETGTAEWGAMLRDGYDIWRQAPYQAVFSGLAISMAVLGFNLFGDGLRDALDPHSRIERN
ncbi:MAG: ABC transporter permease [Planctomycetota bacterium]|jgi:peptide/nickel transport system permease protein